MERMIAEAARAAMAKSGGVVPGAAGKRKDVGDDDAEPKRPPLPVGDPADPCFRRAEVSDKSRRRRGCDVQRR